jgi:peptidoglycan/xylan/chitin deacetylase (PgdA/CDA1 family)
MRKQKSLKDPQVGFVECAYGDGDAQAIARLCQVSSSKDAETIMRVDAIVYLMYHELQVAGRSLCHGEPGYVRYVVPEPDFRGQMNWLQNAGIRGISVSDALHNRTAGRIVITFDDGCETDLAVAAPILRQANFGATFYITVGFLGKTGYLVPRQVRELSDAGFDIGCHSMTHPCLSDLNQPDLQREIADAKNRLEEMIGRPVRHFSCPGGRWSMSVSEVARRAGYHSVSTSRIAANRGHSDPFQLARIVVLRGLPLTAFENLCRGRGLWHRQMRHVVRSTSRRLLGNTLYDRLRKLILEQRA